METKRKNHANVIARECIVMALIQLLKEKTLSEISISELTAKAGVSRMTYYRNYKNKEDIVISHLNDIMDAYTIESVAIGTQSEFFHIHNLIHCFSYFEKHKDFINVLFKSGLSNIFLYKLEQYIMNTWYNDATDMRRYYILQAFAGSIYNLYIAWSVNGSKETPQELAIILNGIYKYA